MFAVKNGMIGFNDQVVFFTAKPKIDPSQLAEVSKSNKKVLGENAVVIEKDHIVAVRLADNEGLALSIEAKGLTADGIDVSSHTPDQQRQILERVHQFVGKQSTASQVNAGFFARCGGPIILIFCVAVMTGLLYILVDETGGAEMDVSGYKAAQKEGLYTLASLVGTTGTLILGGALTLFCAWRAFKKNQQGYVVTSYAFQ